MNRAGECCFSLIAKQSSHATINRRHRRWLRVYPSVGPNSREFQFRVSPPHNSLPPAMVSCVRHITTCRIFVIIFAFLDFWPRQPTSPAGRVAKFRSKNTRVPWPPPSNVVRNIARLYASGLKLTVVKKKFEVGTGPDHGRQTRAIRPP